MKNSLKIASKGWVAFRKEALRELGARPGDRLTVEVVGPGRVESRTARLLSSE